jgi:biopolymer transport protein ExbD
MAQAVSNDEELITGINVTPLVDVVLVLLIVLMVTASYMVSKSIPVDLPKGATGESVNRTLALTITERGDVLLDGRPISDVALRNRIRDAVRSSREPRAIIAADGRVQHRHVVVLVDTLRQEGLSRFALDVEPETLKTSRREATLP